MKNKNPSSLLPYLSTARHKISLEISLVTEDTSMLGKGFFPFLVVDNTNPLIRLIEAQFVTDAESELKRVFLIVQRDQYLLRKDDVWPVSNSDVDESWRRAFPLYTKGGLEASPIVLSNQLDERGMLQPFQSLFYCITKRTFFAPPCPHCGSPLEQCYGDGLLIRSGLQPYSTSLRRYLFCPPCSSKGNSVFYVYESERSDPATVQDRFGLIKGFSRFIQNRDETSPFPCAQCQNLQECYGSDNRVLSRIFPFSFYPFYLFISEAMSLSASDFLPLLSGASADESEAGQKFSSFKSSRKQGPSGRPFLFRGTERFFLEVMYLKLSFLGELVQSVSARNDVKHPDLRLSMERIWVKLKDDQGGLLPFLWNFRVKVIDVIGPSSETEPFLQLPISYNLFFLGHAWFYTLLANEKQKMPKISLSLREGLKQLGSDQNFSFEMFLKERFDPLFLPSNIFWNPEGKRVNQEWYPLWEKSLHLGWSLLKVGFQFDPQWSKEAFGEKVETLREEVGHRLFPETPVESRADVPEAEEDKAIYDILKKILRKWRPGDQIEKELEETVVLSQDRAPTTAQEETLRFSFQGTQVKEDIPETVIIPSLKPIAGKPMQGGPPNEPVQSSLKEEAKEDDFLAETVILGPKKVTVKEKDENR